MPGSYSAFTTVISGLLVYVLGQWILRFIIEPMQEQRKTIGEVAFNLTFLANVGTLAHVKFEGERVSSAADPAEACTTLRKLASQLRSSLYTIPCYRFLEIMRLVRKREAIMQASTGLIGWSNSISSGDRGPHRDWVAEALRIDVKS
jgi:hypothetical protein